MNKKIYPLEAFRWSWAALFLSPFWSIRNHVWIGLTPIVLILVAGGSSNVEFKSVMGFAGLVSIVALGFYGRRLAWNSGIWDDASSFKQSQESWDKASIRISLGILTVGVLLAVLMSYNLKKDHELDYNFEDAYVRTYQTQNALNENPVWDTENAHQVEAKISSPMEPALMTEEQSAHYKAIHTAHPDADSIYTSRNFELWMALHPHWKRVPTEGSSSEVIAMFTAYKNREIIKPATERFANESDRPKCIFHGVMTDSDYYACGLNPPNRKP